MPLGIWEVDRFGLDKLIHLSVVAVACVERRETDNHLISQNADRPPVNWERMTFFNQNLGRQVVGCTTERECLGTCIQDFGKPEVCETNVPIVVHEDVFGLEVSVDDLFVVKMTNCHSNLDGVKLSSFF